MKASFMKRLSIPQIIVLLFVILILSGAILLSLPISSKNGQWTAFLDCLFTATSASCVTGQVTLNTASHWSLFGQIVIISMIEIGGLGFMALLTLLYLMIGRRFDIKQQKIIQESLNLDSISEARPMILYLIKFSLSIQAIGAMLLSFVLVPQYGWAKGIYYSIFHSISAYCNAGFDLFGDSLMSYTNQPFVLFVIAFLIFAGGLGFAVWRNLLEYPKKKKLLLQTRVVLISSFVLIVLGAILFAILEEKQGTFAELTPFQRFANYVFMAVTPRTAGYANVDYASVSLASQFLTIILMFIGGASGSTAGGIKVNTVFVLLLYIFRNFQGRDNYIYKRTISDAAMKKAVYIFVAGLCTVLIASFLLIMTEEVPGEFGLEYIFMEVVSCFSTVGLTMGLTPDLTSIGKIVLILLMLLGRVGLLTFFWSFGKHDKVQKIRYPRGQMMIG